MSNTSTRHVADNSSIPDSSKGAVSVLRQMRLPLCIELLQCRDHGTDLRLDFIGLTHDHHRFCWPPGIRRRIPRRAGRPT